MSTDRKIDYYNDGCSTLITNEFQYNTIKNSKAFFFLELANSVLKLLWEEKDTDNSYNNFEEKLVEVALSGIKIHYKYFR